MKKTGLFGGTFNPIHAGHIKMAEAARKEYKLDVIYFIPCGVPPHKLKKDLIPAKKRLELIKKVIKRKKYFKILDIEIKKKKLCYTVDTILSLQEALATKQSHNVKQFFLIGQDEFEKLHTWKNPDKLAKMVTFLILPRTNKKIKLPKVKNLKWKQVHAKLINISSTQLRRRIYKS